MIFIKTKRGLINEKYIVRVTRHHEYDDLAYVEYRKDINLSAASDSRIHNVTICHVSELDKLGLSESDLVFPNFPDNA